MPLLSAVPSVEHRYGELWRHFSALDRVVPPRSPRGRHRRAVLLVRVTDGALFRRIDRIRAALGEYPNVLSVPDHFLHLPLVDLGGVAPRSPRADEWTLPRLGPAAERAREGVAQLAPFAIDIARVNATEGEIFGELHPPEPVLRLAERLARLFDRDPADAAELPRFPLARVVGPSHAPALVRAIEWFRDRPIGRIQVSVVTLALVRTDRPHTGLDRLAELPLASG